MDIEVSGKNADVPQRPPKRRPKKTLYDRTVRITIINYSCEYSSFVSSYKLNCLTLSLFLFFLSKLSGVIADIFRDVAGDFILDWIFH